MLRKKRRFLGGLIGMIAALWPGLLLAAGEKAAAIVIVADTRGLTGLMKFWGSLYNDSHAWFAALTVVLIPIIGVAFGVLADIVMSHIGIDLKSRELAEH
jgi:hypothetical protein